MSRSQRYRRRRRGRGRHRSQALLAVLVVLIAVGIAGLSVVGWVVTTAASAPQISALKERDPGASTEVLAADGTRLGFISADYLSRPITMDRIPKMLQQATVAIEDERFYKHKGVDYEGIVRAAVKNFIKKKTVEGGSTLTMQLVKNLYTSDKSRSGLAGYRRKIREARLAEQLEDEHGKDWILAKYLNTTSYGTVGGQTAIGVEAAARVYFNKRARDLNLRQSALLAGIPQAPTDYSPILHSQAARHRRNQVLDKMAELGMITQAAADKAKAKGLGLNPSDYFSRRREGYFFDYVKDELIKEYGVQTVKLGRPRRAHDDRPRHAEEGARRRSSPTSAGVGPSSALVTINPRNGYILAMASSADYADSKFNLAAQGERQPGSSFKVFALMTALRRGVNPNTTRYTSVSPTHIDGPSYGHIDIKTYGGTSGGNMNLVQRDAAVRQLGLHPARARPRARQGRADGRRTWGSAPPRHGYPAETLGGLENGVSPLEMATAYATIASGGYRNRPTAITKVTFEGQHRSELPRALARAPHEGLLGRRDLRGDQDPRAEHPGRHRYAREHRLPGRRQDRHDRQQHRRLVRRLHAAAGDGRVGRLSQRERLHEHQYHGGPVDGGTFPADIWGAYMKSVVGNFCGPFPQPKEPFVSRPFFGQYSTTGADRLGYGSRGKDARPRRPRPTPTQAGRRATTTTTRPAARSSTPTSTSRRRRARRTPATATARARR